MVSHVFQFAQAGCGLTGLALGLPGPLAVFIIGIVSTAFN